MRNLILLLFLFPLVSLANSINPIEKEINAIEEIQIAEDNVIEIINEEYFCRICVTLDVIEPNSGSQFSVTSCAGNMFTSCEKAAEKANNRLVLEIAKMVLEMN